MAVPLTLEAIQRRYASCDTARFNTGLLGNVVFAQHDLATDQALAEFHSILCRNVLIYFDSALQHRVTDLFCESPRPLGRFAPVVPDARIFPRAA